MEETERAIWSVLLILAFPTGWLFIPCSSLFSFVHPCIILFIHSVSAN